MKIGKSKMLVISIIYAVWTILAAFLEVFLLFIKKVGIDNIPTLVLWQDEILVLFGVWAMVLAVIIVFIVSLVKNKDKLKDKAFMVPCAVNAGLSLVAIAIGYFGYFVIFIVGFHF